MHFTRVEYLKEKLQEEKYDEVIWEIQHLDKSEITYELTGLLASALNNTQQYQQAQKELLSVKDKGRDDYLWHFRLGYAYHFAGCYEQAEEVLRKAYQLNNQFTDSLILLYWTLLELDKNQEAEEISEMYKQKDPDGWKQFFRRVPVNHEDGERTISEMMALCSPEYKIDSYHIETVIKRLQSSDLFELKDFYYDEGKESPVFHIMYQGELYGFTIYFDLFELHETYQFIHQFPSYHKRAVERANSGISVVMYWGHQLLESFHLQLKILYTLLPDMIGVADLNTFTILSPVWTKMTALSATPPAPGYLYSVHSVCDKSNRLWLHTHGLNRCGFTELEILNSTVKEGEPHLDILNAMAKRAINDGKMVEEKEAVYIAQTKNNKLILCTWIHWKKVIDSYGKKIPGNKEERRDGHHGKTGILHIYQSEKDYRKKKISPVTVLSKSDYKNLLIRISKTETEYMERLARERFSYLVRGFQEPGTTAMVKMSLDVDVQKIENTGTKLEHIWFTVKDIKENTIQAVLKQEPHLVSTVSKGDILTMDISRLTDWILYRDDKTIAPDTAYVLEID